MSLQKIEDVKQPQVGKFYLVPCIWHSLDSLSQAMWLPVIGPWHEDAEIVEFPHFHFHYDWRFMEEWSLIPQAPEYSHAKVASDLLTSTAFQIQLKRRKMLRQMIEFPAVHRLNNNRRVRWIDELESTFKAHTLTCHTCPHRGMSLDGLPIDAQGRVVCNGHGLRWNLNTGRLSPRAEP